MAITIAAILFDLLLVAFGAWCIREAARAINKRPDLRYRVYTNLSCFLILGGLLAWIMFMMAGLAIAPQAPIPDNFSLIMFTMPAATWIGALLQMLANLLFRGCAAEVEVQQCCHTGDTTRWTNSRDERI